MLNSLLGYHWRGKVVVFLVSRNEPKKRQLSPTNKAVAERNRIGTQGSGFFSCESGSRKNHDRSYYKFRATAIQNRNGINCFFSVEERA